MLHVQSHEKATANLAVVNDGLVLALHEILNHFEEKGSMKVLWDDLVEVKILTN